MRIPPYYRLPTWQRFLAGMVLGGAISWMVFLFMFGVLQEEQTKTIEEQKDTIENIKKDLSIWQDEYKKLNKDNQKKLLIQDIKIKILNPEEYKVELLSIHETEDKITEDLRSLLTKDLESVYKNKDLIKKTIEKQTINLNDKRYQLKVKEMYIYTSMEIYLELKIGN